MSALRRRVPYRGGTWLLLAPFLLGSLVLVVLPALATTVIAFTRYDALSAPTFAGLGSFRSALAYPQTQRALVSTLVILAVAVPLRVLGGLALALLLHRRERLAATGRVAVYSPAVVPDPATALVWLWVVNPVYGPVGLLARAVGGDAGPVLLDPLGARLTIIGIAVLALGEGFLVTLAARRELPENLYDLARCEGAGPWTLLRRVTLPLLAPVLALVSARDLVLVLQVTLVPVLLLTDGGPLGATSTLPLLVYERGFVELRFGDAAALSVLLLLGTGAVVALQARLLRRWSRAGALG